MLNVVGYKTWVVFYRALTESQWTALLGYLDKYKLLLKRHRFVIQKDSTAKHHAHNTVQLLQHKILNFLFLSYSPTISEINFIDYKI